MFYFALTEMKSGKYPTRIQPSRYHHNDAGKY